MIGAIRIVTFWQQDQLTGKIIVLLALRPFLFKYLKLLTSFVLALIEFGFILTEILGFGMFVILRELQQTKVHSKDQSSG